MKKSKKTKTWLIKNILECLFIPQLLLLATSTAFSAGDTQILNCVADPPKGTNKELTVKRNIIIKSHFIKRQWQHSVNCSLLRNCDTSPNHVFRHKQKRSNISGQLPKPNNSALTMNGLRKRTAATETPFMVQSQTQPEEQGTNRLGDDSTQHTHLAVKALILHTLTVEVCILQKHYAHTLTSAYTDTQEYKKTPRSAVASLMLNSSSWRQENSNKHICHLQIQTLQCISTARENCRDSHFIH